MRGEEEESPAGERKESCAVYFLRFRFPVVHAPSCKHAVHRVSFVFLFSESKRQELWL